MPETVDKPIAQVFRVVRKDLMSIPDGKEEIEHVRKIIREGPAAITPWFFYRQYVFVVLCSYWKEQYAHREWDACFADESHPDFSKISNRRKRAAAELGYTQYQRWYNEMLSAENKFVYLESLFMIGEVTCRHLARNIGIDTVKPDRHMLRVAAEWGYGSADKVKFQIPIVEKMCRDIQEDLEEGDKEYIGVIDVILWRACNLGWL